MNAVVVLEWEFSPPDYFEEAFEIPHQDCTMTIADGKVRAEIEPATFEANPNMRKELHDVSNSMFLTELFSTRRAYKLSKSTMTRVDPDGLRHFFLEAEPGHYQISGKTVDSQVTDKDGNVISDSKRDRIEKKRRLRELVSKHYAIDATLASLLQGYDRAVRNPNSELVRLYEIREALIKKFGNKKSALSKLDISSSKWDRFGRLCNDPTLRQGRHGGRAGEALRDATEGELTEARETARAMIDGYLNHLEAPTGT